MEKEKKGMLDRKSKVFKVLKWISIIIGLIAFAMFCFTAGKMAAGDENKDKASFMVKDKTIPRADVTHELMYSQEAKKTYAEYVLTKGIEAYLQDKGVKISDKQINDYGRQEADMYKADNPKASTDDFESYVDRKYGSSKEYKAYVEEKLSRAEYAKRYANTDKQEKEIEDTIGNNAHSKKVKTAYVPESNKKAISEMMMSGDIPKGIKTKEEVITPYQFFAHYDKTEYDRFADLNKGQTMKFKYGDGYMMYQVIDIEKPYSKSDVKKAIDNDLSFYLSKDIQKQADKQILAYMKKHKDFVKFGNEFEFSSFGQGLEK